MSQKLEQHHLRLVEQWAREAEKIAKAPAVSAAQRLQARNEAKSFNEIAQFIRETCHLA